MKRSKKLLRFIALSQRMYINSVFPNCSAAISSISVPVGLTADGRVYEYQPSTETWVRLKMVEGPST